MGCGGVGWRECGQPGDLGHRVVDHVELDLPVVGLGRWTVGGDVAGELVVPAEWLKEKRLNTRAYSRVHSEFSAGYSGTWGRFGTRRDRDVDYEVGASTALVPACLQVSARAALLSSAFPALASRTSWSWRVPVSRQSC